MGNLWYQMPLLRRGWVEDNTIVPFASLATNGSVPNPDTEGSFNAPNVRDLLNARTASPEHAVASALSASSAPPSIAFKPLRWFATGCAPDKAMSRDGLCLSAPTSNRRPRLGRNRMEHDGTLYRVSAGDQLTNAPLARLSQTSPNDHFDAQTDSQSFKTRPSIGENDHSYPPLELALR